MTNKPKIPNNFALEIKLMGIPNNAKRTVINPKNVKLTELNKLFDFDKFPQENPIKLKIIAKLPQALHNKLTGYCPTKNKRKLAPITSHCACTKIQAIKPLLTQIIKTRLTKVRTVLNQLLKDSFLSNL